MALPDSMTAIAISRPGGPEVLEPVSLPVPPSRTTFLPRGPIVRPRGEPLIARARLISPSPFGSLGRALPRVGEHFGPRFRRDILDVVLRGPQRQQADRRQELHDLLVAEAGRLQGFDGMFVGLPLGDVPGGHARRTVDRNRPVHEIRVLGDPLENLRSGMAHRIEQGGARDDGYFFPAIEDVRGWSTACTSSGSPCRRSGPPTSSSGSPTGGRCTWRCGWPRRSGRGRSR